MNTSSIQIQNLQLKYKENILFSDFNADFALQKWSCILGPSGVGKSSLLRFMAGLGTGAATAGKIIIPPNLSIGYVSQQDNLLPWLNALDNTLIGFRLRGQLNHSITFQAKELFLQLGLADAIHKHPAELSGGMRQRVSLIRAFLENNDILLLDEPFSALDVITRCKLQNFAFQLLRNKTVIMVTHDPLEALRLSHKLYVLKDHPAQLSEPFSFETVPLREIDTPEVISLQAQLYKELI